MKTNDGFDFQQSRSSKYLIRIMKLLFSKNENKTTLTYNVPIFL